MGRWLAALKKHENGPEPYRQNRQNPSSAGFVGSVSSVSGDYAKISSDQDDRDRKVLSVLSARISGETEFSASRSDTHQTPTGDRATVSIRPDHGWTDEDWQAAYDERAGILEYDEGVSRAEAERLARIQVFGDRPIGNVKLTTTREIS